MKKTMIAAAVALAAFTAAPATANDFTGVRVEATAGIDSVVNGFDRTDVTYGATVGVDAEVYKNVIVGVAATADNVFDRSNIGASARVGYVVNNRALVYVNAGYENWKQANSGSKDGLRVGGGLDYRVTGPVYVGTEYRYSDFNGGAGKHQVLAKVGFHF